jgi:PIN domain-containing protein
MQGTFVGYYRPTEDEFRALWSDCVFVVDANVLLNLYRYPKDAALDLLKTFSQVKDRLWIPHQAALEYQENRLSIIAEQLSKFNEVRSVLADSLKSLRAEVGKLQLQKRHSSIAVDAFLEKISHAFAEFTSRLDELEKEQPRVSDADKLRESVDKLLQGRVGPQPEDQAGLDKIYEIGRRRYAEKRPPGYLDEGKKGEYLYGGLTFHKQFGDLLIWEQILEAASKRKYKHLVFITDDEKEDWWWIIDSKGKKTIGPRPELVEEIKRRAGVSAFYMYSSERFLSYASEYLGTKVKPDTIDQVREVGRQTRLRDRQSRHQQAEEIAYRWVQSLYPDATIIRQSGFPDFVVELTDGSRLGFDVQCISSRNEMYLKTSQAFYSRLLSHSQATSTQVAFIFIADEVELAHDAWLRLHAFHARFPVFVGVTQYDGNATSFQLLYESRPPRD